MKNLHTCYRRDDGAGTVYQTGPRDCPGCTCPRCGHGIPSDERRGDYPGALSRYDNETEICSSCGTKEAFWNLSRPGAPLPPTDHDLTEDDDEDEDDEDDEDDEVNWDYDHGLNREIEEERLGRPLFPNEY